MSRKIEEYKQIMIAIFKAKYDIDEPKARELMRRYDFDRVVSLCDYLIFHDNPEDWVDKIVEFR